MIVFFFFFFFVFLFCNWNHRNAVNWKFGNKLRLMKEIFSEGKLTSSKRRATVINSWLKNWCSWTTYLVLFVQNFGRRVCASVSLSLFLYIFCVLLCITKSSKCDCCLFVRIFSFVVVLFCLCACIRWSVCHGNGMGGNEHVHKKLMKFGDGDGGGSGVRGIHHAIFQRWNKLWQVVYGFIFGRKLFWPFIFIWSDIQQHTNKQYAAVYVSK